MVAAGRVNSTEDKKGMVPTILVGVGGTGAEVLSRVRRFVEETYGSLNNFPIISFLWIDTDRGYKITNPEAAGSPFKDLEKCHATVSSTESATRLENMGEFPWIQKWFPQELERNISSLEAGAGQIRACGRFAFFCNYDKIRKSFQEALRQVKGREKLMNDRHQIRVSGNAVNVFVTGSISGGTGSGMLIDLGYCIRHWLQGEGSTEINAIVPMPNAFAGISVGEGVISNGYAALMELSYFSDPRTEFNERYSQSDLDEVRSQEPPFNFTYLVGTKNGESEFKLGQLREAIAQNIFLDLTSDFAAHKRSIRDNIKKSWIEKDNKGRGYSKQFMSFGLSTIEIPISQIRACLANRLAKDLVSWWLNESVQLPPQMLELVRGDLLKGMRLSEQELIADLSIAKDRPIATLIAQWLNGIRSQITAEDLLQCTLQGANLLGREKGKILTFTTYLQDKLDTFQAENLKETSPDERVHGEFLQNMYRSRDDIIKRGRQALETELYRILEDRNYGVQFAEAFLTTVEQVFEATAEKFRREQEVQAKIETNRYKQYEDGKKDINELKDKYGATKQGKMEQLCEAALAGIEGSANAAIRRKARTLGLQVIIRLKEHLQLLQSRLNRFQQRTSQLRDHFNLKAKRETDSADALQINGIKLYDRTELNGLYQDLIEQMAGAYQGSKTLYEQGIDSICSLVSEDVLQQSSPLWQETRNADETMRLFDLTEIPDVNQDDLEQIIYERAKTVIEQAPENSRLKKELAACDRLFKAFNDENEIIDRVRLAYQKSQPLMLLDRGMLDGAGFKPAKNTNVALLGGIYTSNPAAQKMLPIIQQFVPKPDDLKPLGENERHRIVFVQEMGGFSLRCIEGMKVLRRSYQEWLGKSIQAKRAKLKGEATELPIPVHITKAVSFWDIFPEDPQVYQLTVQARAFRVLFSDVNLATKEPTIRYQRQTTVDLENIDLASNWEEIPQVLEVRACLEDKEEIQRQVNAVYEAAATVAQKQQIYQQLTDYLAQRARELEKLGGKESLIYAREKNIVRQAIKKHQLLTVNTAIAPTFIENTAENNSPSTATEINNLANSHQPPAIVTPQPNTPSDTADTNGASLNQLRELMAMYKEGLLSQAEFEAAKTKLLGL
jgi:hypothetical protein